MQHFATIESFKQFATTIATQELSSVQRQQLTALVAVTYSQSMATMPGASFLGGSMHFPSCAINPELWLRINGQEIPVLR